MLAKALMTFNAFNITAHQGQIIEISDPNIFLDLVQANFVEQIYRFSKDD